MILKKAINQNLNDYSQIIELSQFNMKVEQVKIMIYKKIQKVKETRLSLEIQNKTI